MQKENELKFRTNDDKKKDPGTPDSASLTQCGGAFRDVFIRNVLRDSDSVTKARFPGFT